MFSRELIFPILIIGLLCVFYAVSLAYRKIDRTETVAKKEKIEELDFVRAVCAAGIILFHVACYTEPDSPKFFYTYANGGYGDLLVGVFFVISGGVLQHNYQRIDNLPLFYYKRWKAIFPMFYITYLFFYIRNVVTTNTLFYGGNILKLLPSLLGLDGYFYYKFSGYYIVGEWFLGAIVLLYVLYPVFLKLINVMDWKIMLFAIPLSIWQINTDWFEIGVSRNLIYCSVLFVSGMLIFKHKLYRNKLMKLISCCISPVVLFVPIPRFTLITAMLSYVLAFFALFSVAEYVIKVPLLKNVFACMGGLSYPMFLVQNKVIGFLTMHIMVCTYKGLFKLEILAVCLSMLYAWCIRAVVQAVLRTKWFSFIDKQVVFLVNKGDRHGTDYR